MSVVVSVVVFFYIIILKKTCCINYFCSINIGCASLSNKSVITIAVRRREKKTKREQQKNLLFFTGSQRRRTSNHYHKGNKNNHEHGNLEVGGRDNHLVNQSVFIIQESDFLVIPPRRINWGGRNARTIAPQSFSFDEVRPNYKIF